MRLAHVGQAYAINSAMVKYSSPIIVPSLHQDYNEAIHAINETPDEKLHTYNVQNPGQLNVVRFTHNKK